MRRPACNVVLFSTCSLLVLPTQANAVVGDVVFQNCTSDHSCAGSGSRTGWVRTVETTGCYAGECLRLQAFANGDQYGAGNTSLRASTGNKNELTVVYYVKFDKAANDIAGGNIKGIRPYHGDTNYIFATIDIHNVVSPSGVYESTHDDLFMDIKPAVDDVRTNYYPTYCRNVSGVTYQCPSRLKITFTVNGMQNFGTEWREVRHYIKMPTSASSGDGEWKMWVDGELLLSAYNVDRSDGGADYFTAVDFFPSSEASEPFEQWLDEMVIYEGCVPPEGPNGAAVSAPRNLQVVSP